MHNTAIAIAILHTVYLTNTSHNTSARSGILIHYFRRISLRTGLHRTALSRSFGSFHSLFPRLHSPCSRSLAHSPVFRDIFVGSFNVSVLILMLVHYIIQHIHHTLHMHYVLSNRLHPTEDAFQRKWIFVALAIAMLTAKVAVTSSDILTRASVQFQVVYWSEDSIHVVCIWIDGDFITVHFHFIWNPDYSTVSALVGVWQQRFSDRINLIALYTIERNSIYWLCHQCAQSFSTRVAYSWISLSIFNETAANLMQSLTGNLYAFNWPHFFQISSVFS